jgi:hypothetical protein
MISLPGIIKKQKLTTGYLLIILLFFIFGIVTVRGVFTLGTLTKTIYDHPLVVSNASLHAALGLTKMHRNMKDLVLATAPAEMEAVLNAVDENERNVYQYLDTIRQDILGEEGKALENQNPAIIFKLEAHTRRGGPTFKIRRSSKSDSYYQSKGR